MRDSARRMTHPDPVSHRRVVGMGGWWKGVAALGLLLGGAHPLPGLETVTVRVENEQEQDIPAINAPYVKAQLERVVEVRKQLEIRKQQQEVVLPSRIAQLDREIARLAEKARLAEDVDWKRLNSEALRLGAQVRERETALAAVKPEGFKNHADFLAWDGQQAELRDLQVRHRQAGRAAILRQRQVVARDPEGARLVDEAWTVEAALMEAFRNRADAQSQRDMVNRSARGRIARHKTASPVKVDAPELRIQVPPPRDADARMARFQQRNSPAEVRALGQRFFGQMDLTHPGLEGVARLVAKQDYAAALDAYKVYFFSKKDINTYTTAAEGLIGDDELRASEAEENGEEMGDGDGVPSAGLPAAVVPPTAAAVQEAMEQTVSAVLRVEKRQPRLLVARLGPPGAIHWVFPDQAPPGTSEEVVLAQVELAQQVATAGKFGSVLLDSYVMTGNREHLARWAEITDDWSMNWPRDVDGSARVIRHYSMLVGFSHHYLVGDLRGSAVLNPKLVDDLPSTTLARVLLAANAEYLSGAIRLMRSGQSNFRIMMLTGMIPHALGMREFHSMRWAAREATRLAELSLIHNIRRDGANAVLANAGHENTDGSFIGVPRVMKRERPDWLAPWWSEEFLLSLRTYTRYWFHLLKQDGRAYRINTSPLDEHFRPGGSIKTVLLKGEPEVQARMWKVFGQAFPFDDAEARRRIHKAAVKGEATPEPAVRSEQMPFAGYMFLRTGWERSDYFFYLHCVNQPVASGRDDSNGYTLHGNGLIYLNAPPVFVDGRIQYAGHRLPSWSGGKSMFSVCAKPDLLKETRFHTSPHFDLAEGLYDQGYVYHPEKRKPSFCDLFGTYGMELVARRAGREAAARGVPLDNKPILDVRHTRRVISVQGRDLYIVTDLMDSAQARGYDQKYGIAEPVSQQHHARRVECMKREGVDSVIVDAERNTVRVRNPGYSGMDMHFLANFPLAYQINRPLEQKVPVKKQPAQAPVLYQRTLGVSWKADGPCLMTTLVRPYRAFEAKEPEAALRNVRPIPGDVGFSGFTAEFADGTPLHYASSRTHARLTARGISVMAGSLLLAGDRGIVLDCKSMEFGGRTVPVVHPDFEFVLGEDVMRVEKVIHRPIRPVTIEPAAAVFVRKTRVKLSSATPDVEIRYTLDGSEVRHDSTLYRGPFTLAQTTWVKARAFRKGMEETPWTQDGTHATVQSWAVFEKVDYQDAKRPGTTRPGMSYAYFEEIWPVLMAEGPWLPASRTGVVPQVLDISPRSGTGAFGMRYSGYLEVPRDGVYTFHAPPEFQFNDQESGYDLRVHVNGREWYPASRWHGHGTWSVALRKGKHDFRVFYTDMRRVPHREEMRWGFPNKDFVWQGTAPELKLSGTGMEPAVIPAAMLSTD